MGEGARQKVSIVDERAAGWSRKIDGSFREDGQRRASVGAGMNRCGQFRISPGR